MMKRLYGKNTLSMRSHKDCLRGQDYSMKEDLYHLREIDTSGYHTFPF